MKAIEINTKTNNKGQLKIDIPLKKRNKNVRVLILFSDEEDLIDDDKIWLYSNSQNPSFNFLSEPEENIYSLNDGEPLKND
ncbi:MAG: hypothetical protein HN778_18215 [Prolixibacteraceae bacterium]|jgi:hypothetical protein|nr:hypothetical protein [Prolixibacteraceae bacterium]MBT6765401.1 hypothetical protein [Prolixibacteraceae bacterium]MBT6999548.1 hypothetical protein [Prolixibacteraceae bacterium]MBT7396768.1 hypothetical protein [Prolixibacteraceae bacterium]